MHPLSRLISTLIGGTPDEWKLIADFDYSQASEAFSLTPPSPYSGSNVFSITIFVRDNLEARVEYDTNDWVHVYEGLTCRYAAPIEDETHISATQ